MEGANLLGTTLVYRESCNGEVESSANWQGLAENPVICGSFLRARTESLSDESEEVNLELKERRFKFVLMPTNATENFRRKRTRQIHI